MPKTVPSRKLYKSGLFIPAVIITTILVGTLGLTTLQVTNPMTTDTRSQADTNDPSVLVNQGKQVTANSQNKVTLYLVNMGVPLSKAEFVVRVNASPFPSSGWSFKALPTRSTTAENTFVYQSHFFQPVNGQKEAQDLHLVYTAAAATGYNDGSSQVPVGEITYTVVPGQVAVTVLPDQTRLYNVQGQPIAFNTYGTQTFYTAAVAASPLVVPSVRPTPMPTKLPTLTPVPGSPWPSASPTPSMNPQAEINMLKQQVQELQRTNEQQNKQIAESKSLLDRVVTALRRFFSF